MSRSRIVVFGEGKHELGGQLDRAICSDDLPALPAFVHRVLGCPADVEYICKRFASVPPVHGRGNKFGRKVHHAILQAKLMDCHAAIVVIDRDRKPDSERIVPLKQGRDSLADGPFPPCAVGTAIEAFDAWMIVDGKAIGVAGGDAGRPHGAPEKLAGKEGTGEHPKDVAAAILGGSAGLGAKYAIIALHTDLQLLARRCPDGFAPFAGDVKTRITPAIRAV